MLTKEEVKKIASLARIGIDEKEVSKYQKDISAILDHFKELEELDTKNVEPIEHITGKNNIYRKDERDAQISMEREAILKNSPNQKDNYVKVKSVLSYENCMKN